MINHQVGLETFVILTGSAGNPRHIYSTQAFEDGTVNGTVHYAACGIAYTCIE